MATHKRGHRQSLSLMLLMCMLISLCSTLSLPSIPDSVNTFYPYVVKRSQDDLALQSTVQQLASTLLAASVVQNMDKNIDPMGQNYSTNEYYQPSPSIQSSTSSSNYYLSPQYYTTVDSGTATNPNYGYSADLLEQYAAALLQANQSLSRQMKANKQASLGRRIGELVTNSAERASRAFKTFSQFKLFNDMKPSRLLGLTSDQNNGGSTDMKTFNSTVNMANIATPNAWYYPTTTNMWSSYMTSPSSNMFLQQPLYLRTQEMAGNPSPVGSINNLINPSSVAPNSPKPPDYIGHTMSDFYPSKLSLDSQPMYHSVINAQPNAQYHGTSSTLVPIGSSTTTVFHHFSGDSNLNSATNGQHHSDLFAAPQTQYGLRVKPPKDFEYDGSNEDEMASGEQDDVKMADNSNGNRDVGRNSIANNDGSPNEMGPNGQHNNGPWSTSTGHTFDEFLPDNGNHMEPDMYNNGFNNGNRISSSNRPFNVRDNRREPPFRPIPSPRPFQPSNIHRRPASMPEYDEQDSWYQTFFGSNVKPISRLRQFPFGNTALNFVPHHTMNQPLMNSAASTSSSTALSPESFIPSPYMSQAQPTNFFPFPAATRPAWPYGMYNQPSSSYFGNFRPMMSTSSTIRPVSIPFFPVASNANYFMHRFPRPQPMYNAFPGFSATPFNANPSVSMSANPFGMNRFPTYSMMPSSSSMYPVRMPYPAMMPIAPGVPFGIGSPVISTISHAPMIPRYRYGPELSTGSTRRMINITKRAETEPDLIAQDSQTNMLSSQKPLKISTRPSMSPMMTTTMTMNSNIDKNNSNNHNNNNNRIVPNREEQNLATLYNAYQVLQRRMEEDTQELSSTLPTPHYHYYIGRDTSTTTSTTMAPESSESLDSSARSSLASFNFTNQSRAIKARHVDDQLRHKPEQSATTTMAPSSSSTTSTILSIPTTTVRQGKSISQLIAPDEQWKPLVRITTNRKRN